jgi:hypothetical protein
MHELYQDFTKLTTAELVVKEEDNEYEYIRNKKNILNFNK